MFLRCKGYMETNSIKIYVNVNSFIWNHHLMVRPQTFSTTNLLRLNPSNQGAVEGQGYDALTLDTPTSHSNFHFLPITAEIIIILTWQGPAEQFICMWNVLLEKTVLIGLSKGGHYLSKTNNLNYTRLYLNVFTTAQPVDLRLQNVTVNLQ